jgi:hypothetical protein
MEKRTLDEVLCHAMRVQGAPADVADYLWQDVSEHGGEPISPSNVIYVDSAQSSHVPLEHTRETTYGILQFGWDQSLRR